MLTARPSIKASSVDLDVAGREPIINADANQQCDNEDTADQYRGAPLAPGADLVRLSLSSRGGARWSRGLIFLSIADMNIRVMMLSFVGAPFGHARCRRLLSIALNFPDDTCRNTVIDSLLS